MNIFYFFLTINILNTLIQHFLFTISTFSHKMLNQFIEIVELSLNKCWLYYFRNKQNTNIVKSIPAHRHKLAMARCVLLTVVDLCMHDACQYRPCVVV